MNDRSQLHRSKNNQPNHRSTYCRTDNTLHEDEVSHSDSFPPPATRGCHPPPETLSQPYTQYSILDTLVFHFCTFARGEAAFAPLHGFLTSPCPRANMSPRGFAALLSTCQLASLSPRACACPHAPVPTCPLATFGRVKVQRFNGTA